jgi:hypothetical protein
MGKKLVGPQKQDVDAVEINASLQSHSVHCVSLRNYLPGLLLLLLLVVVVVVVVGGVVTFNA